jgi:hypothetical protein
LNDPFSEAFEASVIVLRKQQQQQQHSINRVLQINFFSPTHPLPALRLSSVPFPSIRGEGAGKVLDPVKDLTIFDHRPISSQLTSFCPH